MTEFRTEEEQIAALKKWWNDNSKSLLIGVGLALAIVFGWKAYQNSQIQMKSELNRIFGKKGLSKDLFEKISKSLLT